MSAILEKDYYCSVYYSNKGVLGPPQCIYELQTNCCELSQCGHMLQKGYHVRAVMQSYNYMYGQHMWHTVRTCSDSG